MVIKYIHRSYEENNNFQFYFALLFNSIRKFVIYKNIYLRLIYLVGYSLKHIPFFPYILKYFFFQIALISTKTSYFRVNK